MEKKEITKDDKDSDFFEKAKSPCCQKPFRHRISTMNNKPYQSWICTKCGMGWNNTKTATWNYEMQKIKPIGNWASSLGSPN